MISKTFGLDYVYIIIGFYVSNFLNIVLSFLFSNLLISKYNHVWYYIYVCVYKYTYICYI